MFGYYSSVTCILLVYGKVYMYISIPNFVTIRFYYIHNSAFSVFQIHIFFQTKYHWWYVIFEGNNFDYQIDFVVTIICIKSLKLKKNHTACPRRTEADIMEYYMNCMDVIKQSS